MSKANTDTTTRVPHNTEYVHSLGKAVYIFAYYEWNIICIVDKLQPGFISEYSRFNPPMTSGKVKIRFQYAIEKSKDHMMYNELNGCSALFSKLINWRNALIHAHPITDIDGAQVLNYQAHTSRSLKDMKWEREDIIDAINKFDAAAVDASDILNKMV